MKLADLVKINHECDEMFIRESDGNFSKPVFHYHLTSGNIPEEILEREVKHFQSRPLFKYGRNCSGLNVVLYLKRDVRA